MSDGRGDPTRRWRSARTLWLCVALSIGAAGEALAQQTPAPDTPDQSIPITTNLGVDQPTSPFYAGSIFQAVRLGNDAVAAPNVDQVDLDVALGLLDLSIVLSDPIPVIDLSTQTSADPRVDIDATLAPAFTIRTAADVPADFVLLHVRTGRADLVDLNIASGRLDAAGARVPLRVIVDQNATLGFRYTRDFGFDENITGAGSVRIESDNVVSFTGTNDYTGGTRIAKGTLRGNVTSLPGDFIVDKVGVLDFRIVSPTVTSTFIGNVSGEGRLLKSGIGRLLLAGGTATHTGGTEVATGILQATPVSLVGNVVVRQGAFLWLLPAPGTPFAGAISGAGTVRASGSGLIDLTGTNSFTGGLEIESGDVRGTTASIPGNVILQGTMPATARVVFDQVTDGTHIGTISGVGTLVKGGAGRLLRQGVTSASLTQIVEGSLAGDTAALGNTIQLTNLGAVAEFSLADVQTYTGSVSGLGDVWKTGTGTLVLANAAQHTGLTVVNAGTLQLEADLAQSSVVRVDPGGRLANVSGAILSGRLVNQGRVAAGSPTTSFPIFGNATMAAGSLLEVSLDAAGNASSLVVQGTATLDAPSYELSISPGDYSVATQYSVLVATNVAIAPGSNAGATVDDLAFISVTSPPSVIASPGVAQVVFSLQEDFSNVPAYGTTPNQVATGAALQQVTNSGTADARTIRDNLVPLRVNQVPAVLDMMAGETLAGFTNSRIVNARNFADTLLRRLQTSSWELTRPPTVSATDASGLPAVGAPRARGGSGAWLVPFGVFSNNDGNGNASDMDTDTYGISGGIDYRLPAGLRLARSENYRFGLALGYTHHGLENATGFMIGSGNSAQTALYGGYRSEHFHAGLAGRFAWTSMQTRRNIVFGNVDRDAVASFDGLEWGAVSEIGAHLGDPKRALFHPTARFQYIHTTQDAFQETGAGDLDLSVPSLDYDSYLLTLGGRISRVFTLEREFGIEPELRAGWTIDFGDLDRQVPATFYVVPGAVPFVTTGAQPDMNSGSVGIGYVMTVGDVPLLSTHYDFEAGPSFTRHVITAGIYFRW